MEYILVIWKKNTGEGLVVFIKQTQSAQACLVNFKEVKSSLT
uniref:Uncharacterized protein n=1 Tax=Anguilla anguilla TaxID=7936 RepID=A0A0E9SH18_ANGAN